MPFVLFVLWLVVASDQNGHRGCSNDANDVFVVACKIKPSVVYRRDVRYRGIT
jgi:hypothetical protein